MEQLVTQYGYLGLFVAILAVPIPGATFLGLAGYLVWTGELSFAGVLAATALANCLGITIAYLLGRIFGPAFVRRYGHWIGVNERRVTRARHWFEHIGRWTLPLGFFIPEMRDVIGFTAGAVGLGYPTFALFAYAGAVLMPAVFVAIGYYAGEGWAQASAQVHRVLAFGAAAIAGLLVLYGILVFVRRRRRQG